MSVRSIFLTDQIDKVIHREHLHPFGGGGAPDSHICRKPQQELGHFDVKWKLTTYAANGVFLLIDIYSITCYTRDPVCISPPTAAAARAACISPPTYTADADAPPVPGVLRQPPHVSALVAGARRVCCPRGPCRSRASVGRTCMLVYTRTSDAPCTFFF